MQTYKNAAALLLALIMMIGCSNKSTDSANATGDSEVPEVADKKMTKEVDELVEEILESSDKMEAAEWLKRYPKSSIGEDEDGNELLLAPVVNRLTQAGAQRVVIEYAEVGKGQFLVAMIVVLPTDAAARAKVFAMEPELSELCQQTPVIDRGQKYLYYSFD